MLRCPMLLWRMLVPGLLLAVLPAQAAAVAELDASPRHHEWIKVASGARQVRAFVAFPEVKDKALAVLVLHENRGLTDWVRVVCDRLAKAGFVAVAPDLLSEFDKEHADTAAFADSDAARKAISDLKPAQVQADLLAVQAAVQKLPACNGKTASVGFCWGGAQSFLLATASKDLACACVFYGSPPADDKLADVKAPVHGFYGENDRRINDTIAATEAAMKKLDKKYEPVVYPGVGHAFLRMGDEKDPTDAVKKACADAWERLLKVLRTADGAEAR